MSRRLRGPVITELGKKAMPLNDLAQFRVVQLDVIRITQAIELARRDLESHRREAASREAHLAAKLRRVEAALAPARERMTSLYQEFEKVYGVSPEKIAYDDITGVMTPLGVKDGNCDTSTESGERGEG